MNLDLYLIEALTHWRKLILAIALPLTASCAQAQTPNDCKGQVIRIGEPNTVKFRDAQGLTRICHLPWDTVRVLEIGDVLP